jgi:hypothetical protein
MFGLIKRDKTIEGVSDIIEKSPNPGLAKAVLYCLDSGFFSAETIARKISIGNNLSKDLKNALFFLEKNKLIKEFEPNRGYVLSYNSAVRNYLDSERPYGPRIVLTAKTRTSGLLELVTELWQDLDFKFFRSFDLQELDFTYYQKLTELNRQVQEKLQDIKKFEENYWHEHFGIPKQYRGVPSSLKYDDVCNLVNSDILAGMDNDSVMLYAKFEQPDLIPRDEDFAKIEGRIKRLTEDQKLKMPVFLEAEQTSDNNYSLNLHNICYDRSSELFGIPYSFRLRKEQIMRTLPIKALTDRIRNFIRFD